MAVYDAETWELLDLLEPDVGFSAIAFSRDGRFAATRSSRGLELRDPDDLRAVLRGPVPAETGHVEGRAVEVSADGRYVKTSSDRGAQLWDAATLTPIGGVFPHDPVLPFAATIAADAGLLATQPDESTIVVWDIDLDTWPERACLAAGRNLTRAE